VINSEDSPHHSIRAFSHRVKQNAERFLCGNLFVCAVIAFPKIAAAFLAPVSLFSSYHTIFEGPF
jgi:hypothetical protein